MTPKKTTQRQGFKTNEFIVYPAHGVGQIMAIDRISFAVGQGEIVGFLGAELRSGDQVVIMSNGGFDNIHNKLLEKLRGQA